MKALHRRGFTLLELGIVIGISAILAAAIVPDLIETMRNRMAEKTAADVALLHDAARLYFTQNNRWPGETSAGECSRNWTIGTATFQLVNDGYLTTGGGPNNPHQYNPDFLVNAWGHTYDMSLYVPVTATTGPACLFGISTNVPTGVAEGFRAFLPMALCNAVGAATPCPLRQDAPALPPPGFTRCCTYVPKPGSSNNGPCPLGQRVQLQAGHLVCGP